MKATARAEPSSVSRAGDADAKPGRPRPRAVRARRRRAHGRTRSRRDLAVGALVGALGAALLLVALRVDSIRLRYRLADALAHEQTLAEHARELTAAVGKLEDPARLAQEAKVRGFVRPNHVIDLTQPGRPSDIETPQ